MPRDTACLARFAEVFLRELEQRLSSRPQRRRKHAVRPPPKEERWPPPIPGWERPNHWPEPTTFATKEEWLAFCVEEREADRQEVMGDYLLQMHGHSLWRG